MASLMKIRNSEGNIIEIPVLQGPKGDQGVQGIQGVKGDPGTSGVYVGSGEMPENCNVQIDPNSTGEAYAEEEWTFTLEDGSTVTKKILVVASE